MRQYLNEIDQHTSAARAAADALATVVRAEVLRALGELHSLRVALAEGTIAGPAAAMMLVKVEAGLLKIVE